MFITLKIKIEPIEINSYLKEFNKLVRFYYNRITDHPEIKEKELRSLKIETNIDSWFVQCAIREAQSWFKKNPKMVFGGAENFKLRCQNKITNEEWKNYRLHPIVIQGEAPQKGNRKCELNIKNNLLIFKPKKGIKIECKLKLSDNYKRKLEKLELVAKQKSLAYTTRISKDYIYVIYDESKLTTKLTNLKNRTLALDLNPNYVGISIQEKGKMLFTEVVENKQLTKDLKVASDNKSQLHQNNKRKFENFQIVKHIIQLAKHWKVGRVVIEDLDKQNMVGNYNKINKLVQNNWGIQDFSTCLEKHCTNLGIKFIKVGAWYSSIIGNICFPTHPDMVASSLELGRRGEQVSQTGKFNYPPIPSCPLSNQWKEETKDVKDENSWVLFNSWLKTTRLKYRGSLDSYPFKVFSLFSVKSKVNLYEFT